MIGIGVILPQSCTRMAEAARHSEQGWPFPLLCDEDRAVSKRYGVWHPLGIDAWNTAHPASFLLDGSRRIRYAFVGRTQFERAPLARILAAAAEARDVR